MGVCIFGCLYLWALSEGKTIYIERSLLVSLPILEDMARYAGQLLAPAEGFGLREKRDFYAVLANLRQFLCTVVSFFCNILSV